MASNTLERTGVVQNDATGETYIPASRRPDGTWRKPRRVKDGYIPQEEMPTYENKGVQWLKSKPSLPPGLDPSLVGSGSSQTNSDHMSNAAKKKAKRKENKKKQQESSQSGASIENVTNSLAGVQVDNDQSDAGNKQTDTAGSETCDKQDISKKLKQLRKKLKQIEGLEKRIQNGELKNPEKDQLEKISKKKDVLEEIEDLELELDD